MPPQLSPNYIGGRAGVPGDVGLDVPPGEVGIDETESVGILLMAASGGKVDVSGGVGLGEAGAVGGMLDVSINKVGVIDVDNVGGAVRDDAADADGLVVGSNVVPLLNPSAIV